jgi:hypothetical protein
MFLGVFGRKLKPKKSVLLNEAFAGLAFETWDPPSRGSFLTLLYPRVNQQPSRPSLTLHYPLKG